MNYKNTLKSAINYIETYLYEDISLKDVADEVGYSYYHMTRLFTESIGESVGSYIKKRRLYEASKRLIYTDEKIITIALDSGFDSSEAFSRAFKLLYGESPSLYRKKGVRLVSKSKKRIESEHIIHITEHISLNPEIVFLDEIELIGICGDTSLHNNKAPKLWCKYMNKVRGHIKDNAVGYSVCETAEAMYTKNDNLIFQIMIASPLSSFLDIPKGFIKKTLTGGKYLVFTHHGSFENLPATYNYIWGSWIMSSKEKVDNRDEFEIHWSQENDYGSSTNIVKIYIPIK